jgi:hypothetical protein
MNDKSEATTDLDGGRRIEPDSTRRGPGTVMFDGLAPTSASDARG